MKDTIKSDHCSMTPAGRRFTGTDQRAPLRTGLQRAGQYGPDQVAGRFFPIACVALEVTQRCNLDCTLCYLSDHAELSFDPPLSVLMARIASIHSHYGAGTSVQITGGDPTLRKLEDLEQLCAEIRRLGMRSCLMTNGIRARRPFLERLAAAGLNDVAFHVDMTQERAGFADEAALNKVRLDYIEAARGLGLRILFNTTVFGGNLRQIPDLARFFCDQGAVAFVSFQLQAETGRGVLRERPDAVTQDSVRRAVEQGYGTGLDFDVVSAGHSKCNRYASVLVGGGRAVSLLSDRALAHDLIAAFERADLSVDGHVDIRPTALRLIARRPVLAARAAWHLIRCLLPFGRALGQVRRQTVFLHNFMGADALEEDRCASCVFMVATGDGPLGMCAHNAQRDAYLQLPEKIRTAHGESWWNSAVKTPVATPELPTLEDAATAPLKHLKGRLRSYRAKKKETQ